MAPKDYKLQLLEVTPINFSLTEGTDIPPPPDTPPEEARSSATGRGPLSSHPTTPRKGAFPSDALSNGGVDSVASALEKSTDGNQSSSLTNSTSPAPSKRPSSVRRFLGLRTASSSEFSSNNRPMSPMSMQTQMSTTTTATQQQLSRKKSTGWFNKRKSTVFLTDNQENQHHHAQPVQPVQPAKPKGPPPPTIPEISAFDGGSLGADDLFKNIK